MGCKRNKICRLFPQTIRKLCGSMWGCLEMKREIKGHDRY